MAEVEDVEVAVGSEAEEVVADSEVLEMIAVEAEMVAAAAGQGQATSGLATGSVKFLSVATPTLAGGQNATGARNPSLRVASIVEMTDEVEEWDMGAETTGVVEVEASEVVLEEDEAEGMEEVEMTEGVEMAATEEAAGEEVLALVV